MLWLLDLVPPASALAGVLFAPDLESLNAMSKSG